MFLNENDFAGLAARRQATFLTGLNLPDGENNKDSGVLPGRDFSAAKSMGGAQVYAELLNYLNEYARLKRIVCCYTPGSRERLFSLINDAKSDGPCADTEFVYADGWQDVFRPVHAYKRKRYSYGQCVNAGSYGKCQYYFQAGRVKGVATFFVFERFAYHAYAQESQNTKSNPMVYGLYQMAEKAGCCPSYKWHECLEKTEKECHGKHGAPTWAFQYDAAGNGHGEAIHGKSHSQEADF